MCGAVWQGGGEPQPWEIWADNEERLKVGVARAESQERAIVRLAAVALKHGAAHGAQQLAGRAFFHQESGSSK